MMCILSILNGSMNKYVPKQSILKRVCQKSPDGLLFLVVEDLSGVHYNSILKHLSDAMYINDL